MLKYRIGDKFIYKSKYDGEFSNYILSTVSCNSDCDCESDDFLLFNLIEPKSGYRHFYKALKYNEIKEEIEKQIEEGNLEIVKGE